MKKRLIAVALAILLILAGLGTFLIVRHVRNNRPPELETLRPRIEALVNASHEINEIFWGEGLPTYPRIYSNYYQRHPFYLAKSDDTYVFSEDETATVLYYYNFTDDAVGDILAYQFCLKEGDGVYIDVQTGDALSAARVGNYRYAKKTTAKESGTLLFERSGVYYYSLPDYEEQEPEFTYTAADLENYDYVRFDAAYVATDELKSAAEKIYAESFLSSVYESMFTGITVSESHNGTLYARYIDYADDEGRGYLMKSNTHEGMTLSARVYLFDTMRMSEERKSNAKDVFVDIDTYVVGDEENRETITVALTLQDGSWFLNSPTY